MGTCPSLNPTDIIAGESWLKALFTTYSLGLSYFEGHILRRGLRSRGCTEIWVVADADGYTQSLIERQSHGVGQDYRLVPVAMANGVFHPKCTYLHGRSEDILLIGSGNLTCGGFGRNIEAIEAFHSERQPEMFRAFAECLDAILARRNVLIGDERALSEFANLSRAAGQKSGAADLVDRRLVHCVNEPIIEQIERFCRPLGPAATVRVLSPFFDPSAAAVTRLAKIVGASKIVVGLLPGKEDASTFPFGCSVRDLTIAAATIDAPDPQRRLHAKILEICWESGQVVCVSGSVNATEQSLCSTKNVEVGVLRRLPVSPWTWRPTTVPRQHVTLSYRAAGIGSRALLHATLTSGEVRGKMIPPPTSKGIWSGMIETASRVHELIEATIDGEFTVRLRDPQLFEDEPSIQIRLADRTAREAVGWVANEWWLEMAALRDFPGSAVQRFARGDATDDDRELLYDFLASSMDMLVPALAARSSAKADPGKPEGPATKVPTALLAPSASTDEASRRILGPSPDKVARLFDKLLGAVMRDQNSDSSTDDAEDVGTQEGGESSDDELDDEEKDDVRAAASRQRAADAITHLRRRIKDRLSAGVPRHHATPLCDLWLLTMPERARKGQSAAEEFVRDWFFATTLYCRADTVGPTTLANVINAAGVLAGNVASEAGMGAIVGIHEALERFGILETKVDWGVISFHVFTKAVLPNAQPPHIALRRVYASRTRRREAEIVHEAVTAHRAIPDGLSLTSTREGAALKQLVEIAVRRGGWPRVLRYAPGRTGCPSPTCRMSLPVAAQQELHRLRIGRCVQCETFLINIDPAE